MFRQSFPDGWGLLQYSAVIRPVMGKYLPQLLHLRTGIFFTTQRVFADAKEKHTMRYTFYRGLAQVSNWVRLKFAAMNLKKLARWKTRSLFPSLNLPLFLRFLSLYHFAACLEES